MGNLIPAPSNAVPENTVTESSDHAQIIACRGDGMVLKFSLSEELSFGMEGSSTTLLPSLENIQCQFLKTPEGFIFHLISGQFETYFNDTAVSNLIPDPDLGEGVHRLHEGDVIRFIIREINAEETVILIFHEREESHIDWQKLELKKGDDLLYISRHEEDISDGEIQTPDDSLPIHYALLKREDNGWIVEDHSTLFGVFVNNLPIKEGRVLNFLDVIRIGHTMFIYHGDTLIYNHKSYLQNELKIDIRERSVRNFFKKKSLLENIRLNIEPGEMVLVLGGSGAGKTTFINAVMGYEKADGTVLEGNFDIYHEYNKMKYDIGFVPQQDLLRLEDTVYDTLDNAAQMRMPADTAKEEREARIEEILEMFGLEREKKSLVEKLSGGQRKRLSIAVEFVAKPSLFFLDEPDSGLDGVMARYLMENLRRIADQDKIVVIITHSPDRAVDLFDKVIVLAKSQKDNVGRLAFFGTIDEAKAFFVTETLEEIVKRINRNDEGGEGRADEFIERYAELQDKGECNG